MKRVTSSDKLKVGDKVYIEHTVTEIVNSHQYPITIKSNHDTGLYSKDLRYRHDAPPETIYIGNPEESLPKERLVRVWDNDDKVEKAFLRLYVGKLNDKYICRHQVADSKIFEWDNMMKCYEWDKLYAPKKEPKVEIVSVPRDIVECLSEQSIILKKYL